jgi:hypothetical protein
MPVLSDELSIFITSLDVDIDKLPNFSDLATIFLKVIEIDQIDYLKELVTLSYASYAMTMETRIKDSWNYGEPTDMSILEYASYLNRAEMVEYLLSINMCFRPKHFDKPRPVHLTTSPVVKKLFFIAGEDIRECSPPSNKDLLAIYCDLKLLISNASCKAKASGKKLIIALAETHGDLRGLYIELMVLYIAKGLGIREFYMEIDQARLDIQSRIADDPAHEWHHHLVNYNSWSVLFNAVNNLEMTFVPVDDYECGESDPRDYSNLIERNKKMAVNINHLNKDGLFLMGSDHLQDMIIMNRLDAGKYEVLSICTMGHLADIEPLHPMEEYEKFPFTSEQVHRFTVHGDLSGITASDIVSTVVDIDLDLDLDSKFYEYMLSKQAPNYTPTPILWSREQFACPWSDVEKDLSVVTLCAIALLA